MKAIAVGVEVVQVGIPSYLALLRFELRPHGSPCLLAILLPRHLHLSPPAGLSLCAGLSVERHPMLLAPPKLHPFPLELLPILGYSLCLLLKVMRRVDTARARVGSFS